MIKKFLNAFLVGALSLCALGTVSSCTDYDDDIDALSERIDDLESSTVTISSLESQISSINSTITSLQSSLTSQIAALGVDDLETQLENLVASLDNYVTNSDLQSTLATLEQAYYTKSELDEIFANAVNQSGVTDLQSALNYIVGALNSASTASVDLQAAIDALEADMADKLAGKADAIDMTTTANAIVAAQAAIEALQEDVAAINLNLLGYATAKEMETTIQSITTINETLESLQEQLDALDADVQDKLYGKADYVDMVTTQNAIAAIQETLDEINALLEGVEENVQDQIDAINDSLAALAAAIGCEVNDWFGGDFDAYVAALGYVKEGYIGELGDEYETVKDYIDTYYNSINDTLSGIINEDGTLATSEITLSSSQVTGLDEALADLQRQITALEEKVAAIEGRIQSLVYAPEYTDGKIYFAGAQYVETYTQIGGTTKNSDYVYLRELGDESYADVTFYVTPKALAPSLLTSAWSLSLIQYEATTKAGEDITISNISADETEGTITLTLMSTYVPSASDKTKMIALHVEKVDEEGSASDYGSSYTTEFIVIASEDGGNVTDNFVLGYYDATDEKYYEAANPYEANVPYTETGTVGFFPDYEMVYFDGNDYISLADAAEKYEWSLEPAEDYEVKDAIVVSGDAANYKYSAKKAEQTSFSLANNLTSMIGNTVTGSYNFYVQFGKNSYITVAATDVRTVVDETAEIYTETSTAFTWDYAIATGTKVYESADIVMTGASASIYNTMAAASGVTYKVYVGEVTPKALSRATEATDFTAEIQLNTNPIEDGDVMTSRVLLTGDISISGVYTVFAEYEDADGHVIYAYCPIEITGAPDVVEVDLGTFEIPYVYGQTAYEVTLETDAVSQAWAKLSKAEQAQYGSMDNFIASLNMYAASSPDYSIDIEFYQAILNAYFNSCNLDTPYSVEAYYSTSSWTYNTDPSAVVKYTATIELSTDDLAKLTLGDAVNKADNSVIVESMISGTTLDFTKHDLSAVVAWYAGSDADYSVTYEITEKDAKGKLVETGASIVSNVLDWGTWDELELEVTATLTYGDLVTDEQAFTFKLNDPISGSLVFNEGKALSVTAGTADVTVDIFNYLPAGGTADKDEITLLSGLTCACDEYKGESLFEVGKGLADFTTAIEATLTYGDVTYSTDTNRISFDNGVLTVTGNNAALAEDVTVTVPVTYTDRFHKYTTTIEFTVGWAN